MLELKPKKIIETISNLKTGEIYKDEKEWKAKGVPEKDIRRDVKVIMPSLDLFPKTKQIEDYRKSKPANKDLIKLCQ